MALNHHELFEKLLEQIKLKDTAQPVLESGQIRRVIVHQQSREWEFHLTFKHVLPFQLYSDIQEAMQTAFAPIAKVVLKVATPSDELNDEEVNAYWNQVASVTIGNSPLGMEAAAEAMPHVDGHQVTLIVNTEKSGEYFDDNLRAKLVKNYVNCGFPSFSMKVKVDQQAAQEKQRQMHAKQAAHDQELVKAAMAKLQEQPKKQKHQAEVPTGPIIIGKKINPKLPIRRMEEITEEENNVVL